MIVLVFSGVPNAECNGTNNIGEIHILDVGGVNPPTIGWMFAENATDATGMTWDGGYTGQTEMTWSYTNWVNDSNGIDTVFYQYKFGNDEWVNRTPTLLEGNSTRGRIGGLLYRPAKVVTGCLSHLLFQMRFHILLHSVPLLLYSL
jgi:hypothetical protein